MAVTIVQGDARRLPLVDASVQCVVTSPPYWGLRDYGTAGQLGTQQTPEHYVSDLADVFDEVRRALKLDGTCWVNLGDSYQNAKGQAHGVDPKQAARRHGLRPQDVSIPGLKPKDLVGIPWMFAFEARRRGWYLRSDIIWAKPNPMPESVTDRPTRSHEYLFLLTKAKHYYYDAAAIYEPYAQSTLREVRDGYSGQGLKDYNDAGVQNPSDAKRRIIESVKRKQEYVGKHHEAPPQSASRRMLLSTKVARDRGAPHDQPFGIAGRNKRTVWTITTKPFRGAHFATFPPDLVEPCLLAGSRPGDVVLDPFSGSGTVGVVAAQHGRHAVLIDLSAPYCQMAQQRNGLTIEEEITWP